MKRLNSKLQNIFYIITFIIIVYLYKVRFEWKVPRDIYAMAGNHKIIYSIMLIVNIALLLILIFYLYILLQKIQIKTSTTFQFINTWLDNTYKIAANIFLKIFYIEHFINAITRLLMKLYKRFPSYIWKGLLIFPRFLLIISLCYDVLYLKQFRISYIAVYFLLIPIFLKLAYYISKYHNEEIEQEINNSIMHIDIKKTHEKIINGGQQDISDFILSDYNTHFKSVEDVFDMKYIIYVENDYLYKIKNYLEIMNNIFLLFTIRLLYVIIFGYICYWYYT